jgi:uncharacterized protein
MNCRTKIHALSAIYEGKVFHARHETKHHSFEYSIFYFLLDLEKANHLSENNFLFGYNRFAWFSFFDTDHGDGEEDYQKWLQELLRKELGIVEKLKFQILCMPRVLGYVFNPISIIYCTNQDRVLKAMVYEVNNTFGERAHYVIPVNDKNVTVRQTSKKDLFVSPFFDMSGYYDFQVTRPDAQVSISINYRHKQKTRMRVTFSGTKKSFSSASLRRLVVTYPLLTMKVIIAIHLQAFKLLLKRVPLVKHIKSKEKNIIIGSDR